MEDLRNNNNQPIRINNPDLVSEFDTSNKDNALPGIQQDCYINNLMGGSNREPKPNYCLHFDKTNPNVRISFPLKSADKDKYRFIIKGEGSHEVLFVDYSGVYISIAPKPYMFNNWPTAYFDLSYIAILDNDKSSVTYGKMLHLFNCEEGAGTILYDSIGGARIS